MRGYTQNLNLCSELLHIVVVLLAQNKNQQQPSNKWTSCIMLGVRFLCIAKHKIQWIELRFVNPQHWSGEWAYFLGALSSWSVPIKFIVCQSWMKCIFYFWHIYKSEHLFRRELYIPNELEVGVRLNIHIMSVRCSIAPSTCYRFTGSKEKNVNAGVSGKY